MSKNNYFQNKYILEILDYYQDIWALGYLASLASWDIETYMPESGARDKGVALARVGLQTQKMMNNQSFVDVINKASQEENLNIYETAIIRILKRELKQSQLLPPSYIEEFEKTISESQVAWRSAKNENKFLLFKPYLAKIIDLNKQKADYLGYEGSPYNALLDIFEEGQSVAKLDPLFNEVKTFLNKLLKQIQSSPKYHTSLNLFNEKYDKAKMVQLNNDILKYFNFDKNRLRIDESSHPFTSPHSANDIRITTRYHKSDFNRSMAATIHEFGHSLYDAQCSEELNYTPIWGGSSLGIHESQSRFWENFVGRSKSFIEIFLDKFNAILLSGNKYSIEDYYAYFNHVKPDFLRVEADEVTYHSHVIIRYEIEKGLIEGTIGIDNVVDYWNDSYEKRLGIRPTNYADGILQDIHWSMGAMGYFSTYSTGTILSATWKNQLETQLGNINDLVKTSDGIAKMQYWLGDNIHQYGSTYTFDELVNKITGNSMTLEPWKKYLNEKYIGIYK